jgi:hypothetical protein
VAGWDGGVPAGGLDRGRRGGGQLPIGGNSGSVGERERERRIGKGGEGRVLGAGGQWSMNYFPLQEAGRGQAAHVPPPGRRSAAGPVWQPGTLALIQPGSSLGSEPVAPRAGARSVACGAHSEGRPAGRRPVDTTEGRRPVQPLLHTGRARPTAGG